MFTKKERVCSLVLLSISLLFYLFFALYDGVIICPDSASYINMDVSREPFYCMFLALLRALFYDEQLYLKIAIYIQSLLAAWAAWSFAIFFHKEFKITFFHTSVIMCIPLMVSLLCRFAVSESFMYSNCIMTEGLTCPLFLIFVRYLLKFCYRKERKYLVVSGVISFVLILTRKQMCVTLILIILSVLAVNYRNKEIRKGFVISVVCAICIIGSNLILDTGYNYIVHGELRTHSGDNRFLATMVIYTSDRTDGERIQDETARQLFYQIYDICEEKGYLQKAASGGYGMIESPIFTRPMIIYSIKR